MEFFVDQIIVWLHWVLLLKLIAVIKPFLKIAPLIILVMKMKETVIHMMNVKGIFFVGQLRYMLHLRRSSLILVAWSWPGQYSCTS